MSEIFWGAYCDGGTRCPSWHKLKYHFEYIGTPYWTLSPVQGFDFDIYCIFLVDFFSAPCALSPARGMTKVARVGHS